MRGLSHREGELAERSLMILTRLGAWEIITGCRQRTGADSTARSDGSDRLLAIEPKLGLFLGLTIIISQSLMLLVIVIIQWLPWRGIIIYDDLTNRR